MPPSQDAVILACRMLEDEVNLALRKTRCALPVVWLERALHERPEKLHASLQREIDLHRRCSHILLAFCRCGNALLGLSSPSSTLVAPRFHDCVCMSLSTSERLCVSPAPGVLYLTRGWLTGEASLASTFERTRRKYGEQTALHLYRERIYRHYTRLLLMDTGAYPLDAALSAAEQTAAILALPLDVCPAGTRVLEKLFAGLWDNEFFQTGPACAITDDSYSGREEAGSQAVSRPFQDYEAHSEETVPKLCAVGNVVAARTEE